MDEDKIRSWKFTDPDGNEIYAAMSYKDASWKCMHEELVMEEIN